MQPKLRRAGTLKAVLDVKCIKTLRAALTKPLFHRKNTVLLNKNELNCSLDVSGIPALKNLY
jgi:hypothetical protein